MSVEGHQAQRDVCVELSREDALVLSLASASDVSLVFHMVNTAYKVEDGDSGVAFKKTDRFLDHDEGNALRDTNAPTLMPLRSAPVAD
jgi:hypothetical protein